MSKSSLLPIEASKDNLIQLFLTFGQFFVYSACPVFLDNYVIGE